MAKRPRPVLPSALVAIACGLVCAAASVPGGPIPDPLPIFPPNNWWNVDISTAPVDAASAAFISFIGSARRMHPDFGGEVSPGSVEVYGFPYAVVDSTVPRRAVQFDIPDESDGVDHITNVSFPFYPIPDEAITQAHWIEGGEPGNVDLRDSSDRHLLMVDRDRRYLYELYNVFYDGSQWHAGSGAVFDLTANGRRPDGWTSADAAGLAILPGLVRYDEVSGTAEIGHAFRVTVRATNGYVFPASHRAGVTAGALPMGARLRLKASRDLSSFPPAMQKIFRAMQRYGLIVADNGSDLFVSGTFDTQWDSDALNAAFGALRADDFEVITLGFKPSALPPVFTDDPLTAGTSVIRAVHITELRTRVNTLRARYGLSAAEWADFALATSTTILARDITELRSALSQVYVTAALRAPTYTDDPLNAGVPIKATHIAEIRAAIVAIE